MNSPPQKQKSLARNTRPIAPALSREGCRLRRLGGCPDLRRFADHSGGTVADSHSLPRFPSLQNVESKSMLHGGWCQHWRSKPAGSASAIAALRSESQLPGGRLSWELARLL